MQLEELARRLRQRYDSAKRNETVCQVILFGIEYHEDIYDSGAFVHEIVSAAGLPNGYVSEVCKGIRLAEYVALKEKGK